MSIRPLLFPLLVAGLIGSVASCRDASSVVGVADSSNAKPKPPPAVEPVAVYTHLKYPQVKYELFPLGLFELHYGSWPGYSGGYLQTDSTITFDFVLTGCTIPECSKMVGTARLRGDTLFVQYDPGATWLLCTDAMDFDACGKQTSTYLRSR